MNREKMEAAVRSGQAFKLKDDNEPEVVELTFDEMVEVALELKAEVAAATSRFKDVKNAIKAEMARREIKAYESPTGTKVKLSDSQSTNYNRELLMKYLGENYTKCAKVSKSVKFLINK